MNLTKQARFSFVFFSLASGLYAHAQQAPSRTIDLLDDRSLQAGSPIVSLDPALQAKLDENLAEAILKTSAAGQNQPSSLYWDAKVGSYKLSNQALSGSKESLKDSRPKKTVGQRTGEAIDSAIDRVNRFWRGTADASNRAYEATRDAVHQYGRDLKDGAVIVKDGIVDAGKGVTDSVVGTARSAKDSTVKGAEAVADKVRVGTQAVSETASDIWNNSIAENHKDITEYWAKVFSGNAGDRYEDKILGMSTQQLLAEADIHRAKLLELCSEEEALKLTSFVGKRNPNIQGVSKNCLKAFAAANLVYAELGRMEGLRDSEAIVQLLIESKKTEVNRSPAVLAEGHEESKSGIRVLRVRHGKE